MLGEKGINDQKIVITRWNGLPVFFQVEGPSALPFDPFALVFYLVSRYEEYLPFEPDEHGRFTPEQGIAYREGFLHFPLADAIVHEFKKILQESFPEIKLPGHPFRFIPSFDIDIAFAHLGKGWIRATAAWLKLILKVDVKQIIERFSTLSGKIQDPYDNFSLQLDLALKYGHTPYYFVLLGDFSQYDRNTSYKSVRFRKLLRDLSLKEEIGLHPSYRSHLHPEIVEEEKRRLGEIIDKPVTKNRYHFLRLKFPESYQLIQASGFSDDYSLGYATMNGFRASTCTPFYFYDLDKEERTNLRLHPFIFMDSAMIDNMMISPGEAISDINNLLTQVKKYGGEAIGIWHNYSLCEKDQYKGWQAVLKTILAQYKNKKS